MTADLQVDQAIDRYAARMARKAAAIIDEIGLPAVLHELDAYPITSPAPGHAVLACRCGRVLDLPDMTRQRPRPGQSRLVLQPIVCRSCAA